VITLIDTGSANLASVRAAFKRLGRPTRVSSDPEVLRTAEFLVLPGVGSFQAGMTRLREAGLVRLLRERVGSERPLLAICLGMQLLFDASEESPEVSGLGAIVGRAERLPSSQRVPQLGWNQLTVVGDGLLTSGVAYFAHSYALRTAPVGWRAGWTTYGSPFVAALERGRTVACQFHPELSGRWGQELLTRWLTGESAVGQPPGPIGPRVIPCLDVDAGRVVKGVKFQGLRDAGDPRERAAVYAEQGADELVILDVSATQEGRDTAVATVASVREVSPIPITVGGGVREVRDASRLLAAGADKVAVNTAALARPELLTELAERFGRQCVVLAVDAARADGGWEVVTHGGRRRTGVSALAWCARGVELGAGEILLTSWDRDGTGDGYDLTLLRAVCERVGVPVIASGGPQNAGDLAAAARAGAGGLLAATLFHSNARTVGAVKGELRDLGIGVRT